MNLAVVGATGRMGRAIVRLAIEAGDLAVVGAAAAAGAPEQGRDVGEVAGVGNLGVAIGADPGAAMLGAHVAIDFSTASAVPAIARAAARSGTALVTGTTGLDDAAKAALDEAARHVAVLAAPNMSIGIEVVAALAATAAARLGPDFEIEVVETHHKLKIDAPSGTANRLVEAVRAVRPALVARHGREGIVGARPADEIGVFALRGGDVIGDHTIHFFGRGERIEITHRASSRDLFAQGAIRAARWLAGRGPGRYSLRDTLTLSS